MSHSIALKLTKETGFDIKYNRKCMAYVVYPLGIFCQKKDILNVCKYIEEELCVI